MTDLFTPPPVQADTNQVGSYRDLLVGEGKKYADDEALAKSRVFADNHIKTLEEELQAARDELKKRMTLEEVIGQIKANRVSEEVPNHGANNQIPSANVETVNREEILNLVKQTVNQVRTEDQVRANVDFARNELSRAWGNQYVEKLKQAAVDLEISEQFLSQMAETNPKAFIKIVTGTQTPRQGDLNVAVAPRTSTTPPAPGITGGTYSSYDKMRRENKALYWTREVQARMHREAQENPDGFFR